MSVLPPPLPVSEDKSVREFPSLGYKEVLAEINKRCEAVKIRRYSSGENKVIFLPEAWEALRTMIYFGKKHPMNIYEQQYQGIGHIFIDNTNTVTVVISHVLYIYSAKRGKTIAAVVENGDDSMLRRLEKERDIYNKFESECNRTESGRMYDPFTKYGKSEIVLFGHTHPNLGVFFSPPDRASSYATPTLPAATFVCDPIRKDMKAMVGVEEKEAQVLVCEYKSDSKCNSIHKTERESDSREEVADEKKSIEQLINDIGENCNALVAKGIKGNYSSCYTRFGNLRIKFNLKCKMAKNRKRLLRRKLK